jgi:hypothetical protein
MSALSVEFPAWLSAVPSVTVHSMKAVTIREAQGQLGQLIAEACRGELIVLTDVDKPVSIHKAGGFQRKVVMGTPKAFGGGIMRKEIFSYSHDKHSFDTSGLFPSPPSVFALVATCRAVSSRLR